MKRRKKDLAKLLEKLFVEYRQYMYRIAFGILHDEFQAEDAVGDAFERLIPYLEHCEEGDCGVTKMLLTRFVKNTAIDIYRKNLREKGRVMRDFKDWLEDSYDPIEMYEQALENQKLICEIKRILPEHYWDVVYMRYFMGFSVKEIAKRLRLDEENVYSRLRRAKDKVRNLNLKKEGSDDEKRS